MIIRTESGTIGIHNIDGEIVLDPNPVGIHTMTRDQALHLSMAINCQAGAPRPVGRDKGEAPEPSPGYVLAEIQKYLREFRRFVNGDPNVPLPDNGAYPGEKISGAR